MNILDWAIISALTALILGMSYMVGRRQKDQSDYYLGGRRISYWLAGSSLAANQVSAISLVGAPAFIALKAGGGLRWLQYELAVPLAMLGIIALFLPAYSRLGGATIYEYLEERFGKTSRYTLSMVFLISRSLGAGVVLLATSYVAGAFLGLDIRPSIVLIAAVALAYTVFGGIRADIYTDLLQLVVLWLSSIACVFVLWALLGKGVSIPADAAGRLEVFVFDSTGLGDGETFSFWPMLFGGLFLYISYYGCDQSQAQRLLASGGAAGARRALVFNAIVRFPIVLTYSAIGVLMISFLAARPEFAASLKGLPPDYLMPRFFTDYLPPGLLGLAVAGMLAASMSSLDSAINSLSAVTWEDFACRMFPGLDSMSDKKKLFASRMITLFWGIFSTVFALQIAGGSETVIELVNKIGSAFYGPVAGVFALGILAPRAREAHALAGFAAGFGLNLILWIFFEGTVSWMWWNLFGFALAVAPGALAPTLVSLRRPGKRPRVEKPDLAPPGTAPLLAYFLVIVVVCAAAERLLALLIAN
ncbi:MAG: sodium/solute symporter [Spirochaetota bacterium]|nr:sodium/solute symporter [Spirochaetota bacterium]